jgi:hypothetical protein
MGTGKHSWVGGVLLSILGLAAGGSEAIAAAGWTSTRTVEVDDPQDGMTAFTLAVPAGWKFGGEIIRDTSCHGRGAGLKTTTQAPDGTAIAYLPGVRWVWTTAPLMRETMARARCPAVDIDTAAGFLLNIAVPNLRANAVIKAVLPLEPAGQASIAAQQAESRRGTEAAASRYGTKPLRITIDGARVRFTYVEAGKTWEEQVQSIIDCQESQAPAMFGLPASSTRTCAARNFYVVRAPLGHLEEFLAAPALAELNKQTQPNMAWVQRENQKEQAKFQVWQKANADQFQAMLNNGREQHDALMRRGEQFQAQEKTDFEHTQALVQKQRDATSDMAHRQVLVSLGRQEFTNPSTGQVIQASAYYDHQWMSSDGSTLIQTDNPNLDPNGVIYPVSQSWTELVPR